MSTLTITSPGVQINEVDLSVISRPIGSTDVLITGFADQGPTEEFTNISSISEFENVFGLPTNGAERYLYHSARQILTTSPGNLLVTRLPYGENNGDGYANSYSALVYPVSTDTTTFADATSYKLLSPVSILLTEDQYSSAEANNITWATSPFQTAVVSGVSAGFIGGSWQYSAATLSAAKWNLIPSEVAGSSFVTATSTFNVEYYTKYDATITDGVTAWGYNPKQITDYASAANSGLIVVNTSKTGVTNLYEGYYLGVCDNSNINPSTNFNSITGVKAVTSFGTQNGVEISQNFSNVPNSRFNFSLSANYSAFGNTSISEILETYPTGYDFASSAFNDSIILVLFKLKTSSYNQDTITLNYSVAEGYAGSLYANRTQNNPNGGSPLTFFIENIVNQKSNNINIVTNPYLTKTGNWTNPDGTPAKTVRVADAAKNIYSSGVYLSETDKNSKSIGNVPAKLQRVLNILQNSDEIKIDVVAEAGLGTIYVGSKQRAVQYPNDPSIFDEAFPLDIGSVASKTYLYDTSSSDYQNTYANDGAGADYNSLIEYFVSLASKTRKDHVFIADPLRNIFIQGSNHKVASNKSYVFSDQVYWPLNNLYSSIQSSYVATYGNWMLVNDSASDTNVWVPPSGFVAAAIASSSQTSFPWSAVAGFSRGTLTNVLDLAVNPSQKQRDLLYKININPIAYFPNDGYVIYGQKTLYTIPSAFDRLNVRRLFLTLEKETQALLKFFVFEPNTFATRTRLKNALKPLFDNAKINDGLYNYEIVCDERNNTPNVIDNNQLVVALYIQPVRTAEFILADFVATRTGINFNEIIG